MNLPIAESPPVRAGVASDSNGAAPVETACDVLVIGGGPAGSTIAALLARQGRDVRLIEKAHHPRFHIGESLLPANARLFDELGVRAAVDRIGMPKWGVEFVSPQHEHASCLDFSEAWDKSMSSAWQVRRADLDEILFRHAAACGAQTHEGTRVREVSFEDQSVVIESQAESGSSARWRARFVIDASGRDTFLANKFKCKAKNPRHNSSALFGHFHGAERLEGRAEGNISIFWFAHGWFWFIPLADGSTSIGAVCWPYYLKSRTKPLKEFFADTIALCPKLAARLERATLIDDVVHATGNYSYSSTRCTGDRYLLLGDAYTFIDPVFSSGVFLAMQSAFAGADLVAATLDDPARTKAARRRFERSMRKGPREFSWFIFRVTNPTMREFFMYPQNPLRVKEALMSLLAGDIYGTTPIWPSIIAMKGFYYLFSALHLKRTFAAWKRRRENIRDVGALKGETVIEAP